MPEYRYGAKGPAAAPTVSLPVLMVSAFLFAFLYAQFGYPAIVSEDPILRYGMLVLYLLLLLSNVASYLMFGLTRESLLYCINGLGGFIVGALAAPMTYPYIKSFMLLPIEAGRWLVGYIPTDPRANIIFYPLLSLIFVLYLVGIYSIANSLFISVLLSTLRYPDMAFGLGLLVYSLANSLYLYMFALIFVYVGASVYMAYLYYLDYFLESMTSYVMLAVMFLITARFMPALAKAMTTGVVDALFGVATFGFTPSEWDNMMSRTVLIWLGTSLIGPFIATILGLGEYFGVYYETYRQLLIFVCMIIAAAGLSTAGSFAILMGGARDVPRWITRILRLAVPGIMYMSLCGMITYDVVTDIVVTAINDVVAKVGPQMIQAYYWFVLP